MSRNQRLGSLGIAAVIGVVAIVLLVAGGNDPEETSSQADATPAATATATATATGSATATPTPPATAKPQPPLLQAGSVKTLRYTQGDTVTFRVRHDAPEEIHVHGYDIKKELQPNQTATVSFKADITGIFEVELEDSATQLAELRVQPD